MKAPKKQLTQFTIKNVFFAFLFSIACLFSTAQEDKNRFSFSAGYSLIDISDKTDNLPKNYGENGANFSFDYGRVINQSEKRYFTVNAKYLTISNAYSQTDADIKELNANSQATPSGAWNGSADKFKLSSYLVGFGFHSYLTKNKKLTSYAKIYIGNATLTNPNLNYYSKNGYKINIKELKNSNFIYTTNAGLSYEIYKDISLGFNVEYAKSSFSFDNQKVEYFGVNGAGTESVNPYKLEYSTYNLNTELIFKF